MQFFISLYYRGEGVLYHNHSFPDHSATRSAWHYVSMKMRVAKHYGMSQLLSDQSGRNSAGEYSKNSLVFSISSFKTFLSKLIFLNFCFRVIDNGIT